MAAGLGSRLAIALAALVGVVLIGVVHWRLLGVLLLLIGLLLVKLAAGHGWLSVDGASELVEEHKEVAGVAIPVAHVGDGKHVLLADVVKLFYDFHGKLRIEVDAGRREGVIGGQNDFDGVLLPGDLGPEESFEHQVVVHLFAGKRCGGQLGQADLLNRSAHTLKAGYWVSICCAWLYTFILARGE